MNSEIRENLKKILIISGTNRVNSNSLLVSKYLQNLFLEVYNPFLFSLCDLPNDLVRENYYSDTHPEILKVSNQINLANVVLFVLPEYHGTYPGIAKFFLDLLPRNCFKYKKVAIIGVSDGHSGNLRGIDHFTSVMNYLRATVISLSPKISNISSMIEKNEFVPNDRARKIILELQFEMDRFILMN